MANAKVGGTWYIDTASSVITTEKNQRIAYIIITPTTSNAILILKEESTGSVKLDLRAPTSNSSVIFPFSATPVVFTQGIYIDTLTNCKAMLVMTNSGGN